VAGLLLGTPLEATLKFGAAQGFGNDTFQPCWRQIGASGRKNFGPASSYSNSNLIPIT
jgi:hypothetical protein